MSQPGLGFTSADIEQAQFSLGRFHTTPAMLWLEHGCIAVYPLFSCRLAALFQKPQDIISLWKSRANLHENTFDCTCVEAKAQQISLKLSLVSDIYCITIPLLVSYLVSPTVLYFLLSGTVFTFTVHFFSDVIFRVQEECLVHGNLGDKRTNLAHHVKRQTSLQLAANMHALFCSGWSLRRCW